MESIVKKTFKSSECLVYTRVAIILIILSNVRHGDSSGNKTKYVRPGEMIELVCPYRKTVSDTPQWLFKIDNTFKTITDNSGVNPELQNYSFSIAQIKLNETLNLKITNITCQHEGTYKCATRDQGQVREEMFFVYLKKAPEVIILVNSVSQNMQNTSTINITENAELTLSCYSGDGIPKATVYWSINTEDIILNSKETEWSNISFHASRKNDKNNFTCTVVHEMLTYTLTKTVILNVFYSPVVEVSKWPNGDILEGHSVIFNCSSISNPAKTNIQWSKDNITLVWNSTYTLNEVTRNDTGLYVCQVNNSIGLGTNQISIEIKDIGLDHTEIAVVVEENESPIVIYLVVCCCLAVLVATTAELYSCWKSGKLGKCKVWTVWTPPRQPNQEIEMHMADVDHYTEIYF